LCSATQPVKLSRGLHVASLGFYSLHTDWRAASVVEILFVMYKKGVALEIQFSPERLNDGAGDPYWIDLTLTEAQALLHTLQTQLAANSAGTAAPLVVSLDDPQGAHAAHSVDSSTAGEPIEMRSSAVEFKQWVCVICGWIYDEAAGVPEEGIAPGTRWADVPADWRCPLCDVGKEDFALVEF
jgi:rubredoxin